jgi:hypothetical protein
MSRTARADVARAMGWGLFAAGVVLAGIYFGSRRLRDFDAALVPYAGASVFSAFGLGYRYSMWLTKPPTRLFWRRGWRLFFAPSRVAQNLSRLAALFAVNIVAQRSSRSDRRCGGRRTGSSSGAAFSPRGHVPAVVRLDSFRDGRDAQERYQAFVFGQRVFAFDLASPAAPLVFNVSGHLGGARDCRRVPAMWRRPRPGALPSSSSAPICCRW